MLTQSNTAIYVDMDKALTELAKSDKPSAKTDMQIFQCMANLANQDGTVDMRTSGIADTVGVRPPTVVTSAHRLEEKGFIRINKGPTPEGHGNMLPRNVYTIAPAYMLNTTPKTPDVDAIADLSQHLDIIASVQRATLAYIDAVSDVQDANTEIIEGLKKRIAGLENAIKANGNN